MQEECYFLDISALEDELTTLPRNIRNQLPTDVVSHPSGTDRWEVGHWRLVSLPQHPHTLCFVCTGISGL